MSGPDGLTALFLVEPEPWMVDSACNGTNPDLFFPDRGESPKPAKAVCAGCPVRDDCLDYALRTNQKFGIFGGKSPKERRRLRKERGYSTPLEPRPYACPVNHVFTDETTGVSSSGGWLCRVCERESEAARRRRRRNGLHLVDETAS